MQDMNSLAEIIRAEATQRGVLPFARFMELALYHPEFGYYETQKHSPGRRGDFYTSVSTGELFGQLLACQFSKWLEAEAGSRKPEVRIVEAGAHDGKLAGDILRWLQLERPNLFDHIEYGIVEPSTRRRAWQRETLKMFAPRVRWFSDFQELARQAATKPAIPHSEFRAPNLSGIIFSNELLDAFPVHRFGWDAENKKWFEWGVAVARDALIWARIEKSERDLPSSIFHLPSSLLNVLPDGYTIETSPAAESWWREAAGVLARGKLLAIDYGLTGDEMFSPARPRGTLRAYSRHHANDDLLANPGDQDLTAHVNFSAIRNAGENAGLTTEFFGSQTKFLVEILAMAEKNNSPAKWSANQKRQFQTLTHPEHLGRAFRVLVQSRRSS
jgi:SAM-dependent MidA family methyltransferase